MNDYNTLLADADIAGVFEIPAGDSDTIAAGASANQHLVYRIDLRSARSRDEMLSQIGEAMTLPEWYGNNFDGLVDCLCDMSWSPAAGYTLIIENCHNISSAAPADFNMLIDIFADVAQSWREQAKPFWCFVDLPANI